MIRVTFLVLFGFGLVVGAQTTDVHYPSNTPAQGSAVFEPFGTGFSTVPTSQTMVQQITAVRGEHATA